ncbi:MAG TPA: hypothetical protein RMH85_32830 [Polyangiaceae bacterium LLY-WYZ-15_(1-7)]|nr:hypothetical protein [Myxococcales bacterium]MAT30079.1 hypothetical protein [Sandaracinus sp.]HJL00100.1 hypothetical protein [Polyangiaceae bacterium LLY-WYZ-15_(1-7)]HJL13313.1 hypothetical protein [Polyangiaceae bacterium LLY-WYZ-15_(1-7)]HJL25068.1 hypothetical protein [Polyangiaceae bacterium LLY-WYZ-15_(1-7)]
MGEATSGRTSERRGPSEAEALAMARELAGPVLGPKRAARMRVVAVGEVVRAQLDESLDETGSRQLGRVARQAVAWAGPPPWEEMVEEGAVPEGLQMAPLPLPEAYRGGASALGQLPEHVRERLQRELDGWARDSGGVVPPHRVKAWREEVVHARTGELHVWVGGTSQQLLLVVRERTGWRVARGAGITALAGAGAGGFGLVLGPLIGASAFVLGASIAGAQVWETLRRRWRTVWSPARRIAV